MDTNKEGTGNGTNETAGNAAGTGSGNGSRRGSGSAAAESRPNTDSQQTGRAGNASHVDHELDAGAGNGTGNERVGNTIGDNAGTAAGTAAGNSGGSNNGTTRRNRGGRPKGSKNKAKPVSATVESTPPKSSTPRKTTTRRSKKITGEQVEKGTMQLFGLVAMVRGPHWKVDQKEVESWSDDAAELLNKIPASTFDRFAHISTGIAVAVGMGSIVLPRAYMDMTIAKQKQAVKQAQQEAENASDGSVPMDMENSEQAPSEDVPTDDAFSRQVAGAMGQTAW